MFYLDISSKDINEEQFENMPYIYFILFVFHLEILGKENEEDKFRYIKNVQYKNSIPFW